MYVSAQVCDSVLFIELPKEQKYIAKQFCPVSIHASCMLCVFACVLPVYVTLALYWFLSVLCVCVSV